MEKRQRDNKVAVSPSRPLNCSTAREQEERIKQLEKMLHDLGVPDCDICYSLVPTEQVGDLFYCKFCQSRFP